MSKSTVDSILDQIEIALILLKNNDKLATSVLKDVVTKHRVPDGMFVSLDHTKNGGHHGKWINKKTGKWIRWASVKETKRLDH